MKRYLTCMMLLLTIGACSNDDNETTSNPKIAEVKSAVEGQWTVSYYFENGNDETSVFDGYVFNFDSDNNIAVTKSPNEYTGTWSVMDDATDDNDDTDGPYDDIDFMLTFTEPPELAELSEDWEIITISDTKLELRHISGGNGGTDFLTFGKP